MTAQRGKDLLLKIDTTGSGEFATVAGLRARRIALNAAAIDITHTESPDEWRELLGGAGMKTARLSGSGIFKDAATDETVRSCFFGGVIRAWQVIVPDFGVIEGPFQVTALEYSGAHDNELTFEIALESAGALNFTAA
jgi:TP901-1 family phage major tail protein